MASANIDKVHAPIREVCVFLAGGYPLQKGPPTSFKADKASHSKPRSGAEGKYSIQYGFSLYGPDEKEPKVCLSSGLESSLENTPSQPLSLWDTYTLTDRRGITVIHRGSAAVLTLQRPSGVTTAGLL